MSRWNGMTTPTIPACGCPIPTDWRGRPITSTATCPHGLPLARTSQACPVHPRFCDACECNQRADYYAGRL